MFMNLLEESKKMLYDIKVLDDGDSKDIDIIRADMNDQEAKFHPG